MNVVGNAAEQPDPKESYAEALAKVTTVPTETLVAGDPLNRTLLVSVEDYQPNWNADKIFEHIEILHERYGLVVFLPGVVVPVGFSLLRFIPFPGRWVTLFNAWIVDPPAIGRHHKVPTFWGLTNMPTRGQALFIAYLTILNLLLCATGYSSRQPNSWWPGDRDREILTYVTNRTGVLSFANIPLLILYAGRNNVMLWLTNWSHDTFILLHRYVAVIATLQAIVHSLIYLYIYVVDGDHSSESKLPYWYWGAIATIGMSVLLPMSILPLRRMLYEAFLLWHIAVSVLVMAGCYLHIYDRFGHQWGYEVWIYVAIAVWVFDRLLRTGRFARAGIRYAKITIIDHDYIRVDIEGVGGNGHAYLYFPTLTWRVWENHPFSVASSILNTPTPSLSKVDVKLLMTDIEKDAISTATGVVVSDHSSDGEPDDHLTQPPKLAMTFLLRTRGGLTSILRRAQCRIPVLVEPGYGQQPHTDLSAYPMLICVAGGVGITTVIPLLRSHPGRSKLLWGMRTRSLGEAMAHQLGGVVEKQLFVGERMDVRAELERELCSPVVGNNCPVAVVVSGPAGMADDVRNAVCGIAKRKKDLKVKLIEESFSW
ncbi:uncharacterized protein Z520_02004 [Fonsecaea multimorphosa CBS 102226]|uniref:Ferric oxidoreductase domain-containing protein n=1 Tax=Fonsecaea multimorphosa CBS 102226 TaxID=1442371 RepID=A0A0D2HIZ5_9EURO|nr:uncharacterized protein Z520_02004 [Fonsecaea multimorphosa CBS 102226]KIY01866.1 hypothetical protein Z520_02004 [Fonsecaea multimorphosa CBS 102226]OAL29551.1 hypothetical protein AYO22_01965 [Fonsecaea multimorphosa]